MTAPEPIEGYEWMPVEDARDRVTPQQMRALYSTYYNRPRDRVIEGKRWVAIPVEGLKS